MSAPDSLRDTLAHALLGTPNVSVYGVGDEWENALAAADFMLREYDWPWPVPEGPGGPEERRRKFMQVSGRWMGWRVGEVVVHDAQWEGPYGPAREFTALHDNTPEGIAEAERQAIDAAIIAESSRGSVPGGSPTEEQLDEIRIRLTKGVDSTEERNTYQDGFISGVMAFYVELKR